MKEYNVKYAFELWKQNEKKKDENLSFYQNSFDCNTVNWQKDFNKPIWYFKKDQSKGNIGENFYIKKCETYKNDRIWVSSSQKIFVSEDINERVFILNKNNILENIKDFMEVKNNPYYFIFRDHKPNNYTYGRLENPMNDIISIVKSLDILISNFDLDKNNNSAVKINYPNIVDELRTFSKFYPHKRSENYNEVYQHCFDLLALLYRELDNNKMY